VLGLAQYKIKRLLAYSTISHVGFLLLALAINTEQSTESLIFYVLQYSISNLDTFLVLLALGYTINYAPASLSNSNSMDIKYISELKAQFVSNPLLTLSLAVCLFSMAGIPPLVGFFAKQQILYSASYSGFYFMTIVAILVSVISCSYYLQIIKIMHFSTTGPYSSYPASIGMGTANLTLTSPYSVKERAAEKGNSMISNIHSVLISILTLSIMLFILNPNIILNSTHLLALTIFMT
jgi:NADH-ubiquinone oxidoreductase chain 2